MKMNWGNVFVTVALVLFAMGIVGFVATVVRNSNAPTPLFETKDSKVFVFDDGVWRCYVAERDHAISITCVPDLFK